MGKFQKPQREILGNFCLQKSASTFVVRITNLQEKVSGQKKPLEPRHSVAPEAAV